MEHSEMLDWAKRRIVGAGAENCHTSHREILQDQLLWVENISLTNEKKKKINIQVWQYWRKHFNWKLESRNNILPLTHLIQCSCVFCLTQALSTLSISFTMNIEEGEKRSAHSIHSRNLQWHAHFMKMYWSPSVPVSVCMLSWGS